MKTKKLSFLTALILALNLSTSEAQQYRYSIVAQGNTHAIYAKSLNNCGQVLATVEEQGVLKDYLFSSGVFSEIPQLDPTTTFSSEPLSVNDAGQLAGGFYFGMDSHAAILTDNTFVDLNIGTPYNWGQINRLSESSAVGWVTPTNNVYPKIGLYYDLRTSRLTTIPFTPPYQFLELTATNSNGIAAGYRSGLLGGHYVKEVFRYSPELGISFLPASSAGDLAVSASDINDHGAVVGTAAVANFGHAYIHEIGKSHIQDIGTLPNFLSSRAVAINNNGKVIGMSWPISSTSCPNWYIGDNCGMKAFTWDAANGMVGMDGRIIGLGSNTISWIYDINDLGQILIGLNVNNHRKAAVLTPTDLTSEQQFAATIRCGNSTPTPSPTSSPTATASPTLTPSASATPSALPSSIPTPNATVVASPSSTAVVTPSLVAWPTMPASSTFVATPSVATPSLTPTQTIIVTGTPIQVLPAPLVLKSLAELRSSLIAAMKLRIKQIMKNQKTTVSDKKIARKFEKLTELLQQISPSATPSLNVQTLMIRNLIGVERKAKNQVKSKRIKLFKSSLKKIRSITFSTDVLCRNPPSIPPNVILSKRRGAERCRRNSGIPAF